MLPVLLAGIILYGIVLQFTGMWFVSDKQQYTLGLWIGILLAIGMAVNMAVVILDSVDAMASRGTAVRTGMWSVLRYVIVIGAFVAVWYFDVGNPVVMFLGVMGLKVSAYLQPFFQKLTSRVKGTGEKPVDGI